MICFLRNSICDRLSKAFKGLQADYYKALAGPRDPFDQSDCVRKLKKVWRHHWKDKGQTMAATTSYTFTILSN